MKRRTAPGVFLALLVCHSVIITHTDSLSLPQAPKFADDPLAKERLAKENQELTLAHKPAPEQQSLIEEVLPAEVEADVDDITSCSPYISLDHGRQIDIATYVFIKNNKKRGCLDPELDLVLNVERNPKYLSKAMSRGDQKSDTILCREFVELFKLVDVEGMTQQMCSDQVLKQVSTTQFCITERPTQSTFDATDLVQIFTKDDLLKIAATYKFLSELRGQDGCERVCGGRDNAFCNAYVNLTQFFVTQRRIAKQPRYHKDDDTTDSLLRNLEGKLYQSSPEVLRDILQSTYLPLKSTDSPSLLNDTLKHYYPWIPDEYLKVIEDNREVVRYTVEKVIRAKEKDRPTSPPPTITEYGTQNSVFEKGYYEMNADVVNKPKIPGWYRHPPQTNETDYPDRYPLIKEPTTTAGGGIIYDDQKEFGESRVWHLFKVAVVLGGVTLVVYLCVRNRRKIGDILSPYIGKLR